MRSRLSSGAAPGAAARRAGRCFVAVLIAGVALGACGNERTRPPDLARPADPGGFRKFRSAGGDVKLPAPKHWAESAGVPPEVTTFSSGDAAISVWAYPRFAVPKTSDDMQVAKQLLLRSLRKRAPSLELSEKKVTTVGGSPAIELEGRGKISKHAVRIRSVHIYEGKGEYVVDAYADPDQFALADRIAFTHIIDGIRVGGDPKRIQRNPGQEAPALPPNFGGAP